MKKYYTYFINDHSRDISQTKRINTANSSAHWLGGTLKEYLDFYWSTTKKEPLSKTFCVFSANIFAKLDLVLLYIIVWDVENYF